MDRFFQTPRHSSPPKHPSYVLCGELHVLCTTHSCPQRSSLLRHTVLTGPAPQTIAATPHNFESFMQPQPSKDYMTFILLVINNPTKV